MQKFLELAMLPMTISKDDGRLHQNLTISTEKNKDEHCIKLSVCYFKPIEHFALL